MDTNQELNHIKNDMQDIVAIQQQIQVHLHKMDNPLYQVETNLLTVDEKMDHHHVDLKQIKKSWWKNEVAMVFASFSILLTTVLVIVLI